MTVHKSEILSQLDPTLFISCVLSAVDREGDPRNLMVMFDLFHFMLLNYCQRESKIIDPDQLEMFLEDIFDKLSCYFPIEFTPPKDDKFKI